MNFIFALDRQFFFFINHLPHTELTDLVGKLFSGVGTSIILWGIVGLVVFVREEKKHPSFFVPLFLSLLSSWTIVELLMKPLLGRHRPVIEMGALLVTQASGYSFPSSHAALSWAFATVFSAYEPRWRWMFIAVASIVSLSRVYLGVHFPIDIFAGAVLGWVIGHVSLIILSGMRTLQKGSRGQFDIRQTKKSRASSRRSKTVSS